MSLRPCVLVLTVGALLGSTVLAEAPIVETLVGTATAVDGDTLRFSDKVSVRLKGIAAPERSEAGGPEATALLTWLVGGQEVTCELTKERTWGRRVGFCDVAGIDLGELMVRAHHARPCPRYDLRYVPLEDAGHASLPLPKYCQVKRK